MTIPSTIQLNQYTIGYAEYGDLQGYPLFVFHGMPGSRKIGALFDRPAQTVGLRIITPERAGYGVSPARYFSLKDYAREIEILATGLEIEQYAVVGISGGGPYALACAAYLSPERLITSGLISAMGPLFVKDSMDGMMSANRLFFSSGRFFPGMVGWFIGVSTRANMSTIQDKLEAGESPIPGMDIEEARLLVDDLAEGVVAGGKGVTGDLRRLWKPWEFELADIRMPVYMWHGEKDIMAPAKQAHRIAAMLPECRAVFYPEDDHTSTWINHTTQILETLKERFEQE